MTRPDYAAEYDNSGRVENSAELIDAYIEDAANFRATKGLDAEYDLAYGPETRNKMDLFWPDDEVGNARTSPIVVFIHGGYWQRLDRSAFSHMAEGLLGNGMAVALPSYTLAPDITISGIINEMRRACLVLYQTYKRPLTVTGHSAGGHLAACMLATDWPGIHPDLPEDLVQSAMGISGLYDLAPLLQTPINDALGMDIESARASSPLDWMPPPLHRFQAWVGDKESDEYHRQSRAITRRWSMLGTSCETKILDNANHFTIIDKLRKPDSKMVKRIVDLVENPVMQIDFEDDETAIAQVLANGPVQPRPLAEQDSETDKDDGAKNQKGATPQE
ncbi:alpha/beta hydrolase [Ahrensia sp. R2A130]|uniref:alpha/beta hydrolase n=1 Tax=Ahrensia sp. R2A130 TaxID=744979 RepID=UPI0001E0A459|nr:alpha/beta hydrolase [Ahrensia sp. R2A130]EFL90673.1 esterase/lipase/thioesterase [Ahrensia sp. R2A130]